MNATQFLRKVQKIDSTKIASEALELEGEALNEKNREQLLAGKLKTGKDLYPTYLEDPYFKTKEAAQRYSDWKDEITPNPKRKKGVPNLYIVGKYHRSRKVQVDGDVIKHSADFLGPEISQKYGPDLDGLGGEFKAEFIRDSLKPTFKKVMERATGLKFKSK